MGFGHRLLTLLDALVHEFLNVTAIHTQDVVVMVTRVELEHGHTIGEMMPCHESGRLKLGQHAINRRNADVLAQIHQPAVNVLGRQVPIAAALENVQYLDSRQRDFQAGFAKILAFHLITCSME